MIPFSPPRIDDKVISEVTEALKSGWITSGPRTKKFEDKITEYTSCKVTVAVSSWTMGVQVLLSYWGIKEGDEVIIPSYTYCATANVIIHSGAIPVMVDINKEDFNLNIEKVREAITEKTKAIIAVDIGGFPADYNDLMTLINEPKIKAKFNGNSDRQKKLARILLISDSAHSFGALYYGKRSGILADISSFSFHAVKNLTTAEGGALCFNLPEQFNHDDIYKEMCAKILHGQNKDALAKTKKGNWKYDVIEPGFKCNLTDIQAAIGIVELDRYQENLEHRKQIFDAYSEGFKNEPWAILPIYETRSKISSYHLYLLRIRNITEDQRDAIIEEIFNQGVSVNVHFQPLPILTAYRKRGYKISNYPNAYSNYINEITLPVYYDLSKKEVNTVISAVKDAINYVLD